MEACGSAEVHRFGFGCVLCHWGSSVQIKRAVRPIGRAGYIDYQMPESASIESHSSTLEVLLNSPKCSVKRVLGSDALVQYHR